MISPSIVELVKSSDGATIIQHYPAKEDGTECVVASIRMPAEFPQIVTNKGVVINFGSGNESMKLAKKVAEAISEGMMTFEKWQTSVKWTRVV